MAGQPVFTAEQAIPRPRDQARPVTPDFESAKTASLSEPIFHPDKPPAPPPMLTTPPCEALAHP
eukprot:scaffold12993_cov96-Isochrysis_galbana.AAC.7